MDDPSRILCSKTRRRKQKNFRRTRLIDVIEIKSLEEMTNEYEKKIIKKPWIYMEMTQKLQKVAKKLGISVVTLYRKLNNYYCE